MTWEQPGSQGRTLNVWAHLYLFTVYPGFAAQALLFQLHTSGEAEAWPVLRLRTGVQAQIFALTFRLQACLGLAVEAP